VAHSPPPPGPPPPFPDLPPPELDAGSLAEGKEGGGRDLFLPPSSWRFGAWDFGWWRGRTGWWPGLQIRPRGGRIRCSLARISHGRPCCCCIPVERRWQRGTTWSATASRWQFVISGPVVLPRFLVVRASGFDDGEASFGFRDYFWRRHLHSFFACVFHVVPEARVILASICGFSYSEDGFHLHFVPVDYARTYIGHFVAWYSR